MSAIISGTVYAGGLAGFDHYTGEEFGKWKFLINFLYFAIIMGLVTRYNLKKQDKQEKNN